MQRDIARQRAGRQETLDQRRRLRRFAGRQGHRQRHQPGPAGGAEGALGGEVQQLLRQIPGRLLAIALRHAAHRLLQHAVAPLPDQRLGAGLEGGA
ncbi:hypothetical protein HMPREF0731_2511, partial [Pseudoroseomonas cervicalis ATCC 49957]